MKSLANPLVPGTAIRTHPAPGYWGCAVVLTAFEGTPGIYPCCHIATTVLIRKRKYSWSSVLPSELALVRFSPHVRIDPGVYVQKPRLRTSIKIHTVKSARSLDIIGRVDPASIYPHSLKLEVGDGTHGTFPLAGPIGSSLGSEAVVVWRQIHDAEKLELERQASRDRFEEYEKERLALARRRRKDANVA